MRGSRTGRFYLLACAALLAYVALCTGFRENHWAADAWEHHRAIKALVEDLGSPGNPTLAVDEPSIRYSPYTLLLALVCRGTGLDPYDALSGAAVVNTALLLLGLWLFLRSFGRQDDALCVLPFLLFFYGRAPAYANSLALTDLPWHQVNPSACGVALALLAWTLFRRARGLCDARVLGVAALAAFVLLCHAMTGVFLLLGLALLVIASGELDRRRVGQGVVVSLLAFGLALLWPWYSFRGALTTSPDLEYWFDGVAIALMLSQWCLPALLVLPAGWSRRDEPLMRLALIGTAVTFAAGAASFALRSPAFGRLPLVGLLYAHIGLGLFAARTGLFTPGGLRALFPALLRPPASAALSAWSGLLVLVLLAIFARWQLLNVAWQPHLARAYIAPLLGKDALQDPLRARFAALLSPVGMHDVVLADLETSWPIPSIRGRIVAALHFEFFARDQRQRVADVERFFGDAPDVSDTDRHAILQRYGVRWIVLRCSAEPGEAGAPCSPLLVEPAVAGRQGDLVLMDARAWAAARS